MKATVNLSECPIVNVFLTDVFQRRQRRKYGVILKASVASRLDVMYRNAQTLYKHTLCSFVEILHCL